MGMEQMMHSMMTQIYSSFQFIKMEATLILVANSISCPRSIFLTLDVKIKFPWNWITRSNETELGMSRGIPEPKLTAVDAMIDKLTGAIFVFQIVVVIVLGIAGNVWKDTEAVKQWYVLYSKEGPWYELLVIPLRFELLCSIMIPISIRVSLDLLKSLYAKFIDWDNQMIDQETSTPSHATNTAISEDLGQVEYILTDKTGTLTENRMIFRRSCITGIFYGNESGDALKDVELLNAVSSGPPYVIRFVTVMAICNTVIPVKSKTGATSYEAQSQDEDALVQAAACLHMVFVNKNANTLEINFNASIIQYEVLDTLEFTSDRKRMSVMVKDCQNRKIFLLSKRSRWEWSQAEVCQRLEHDLELLGVTAIEERLQHGISETIEILRKAGINFWMPTKDKQNTAIQIALSCNFISSEPKGQLLLINGKTEDEAGRSLDRVLLTKRITTSEPKLVETLKSCDYRILTIGDYGNDVEELIIQLQTRWSNAQQALISNFWMAKKTSYLQRPKFIKPSFDTKEIIGCQSDFTHGVHPENNLGYSFMASGMVYAQISVMALKLWQSKGYSQTPLHHGFLATYTSSSFASLIGNLLYASFLCLCIFRLMTFYLLRFILHQIQLSHHLAELLFWCFIMTFGLKLYMFILIIVLGSYICLVMSSRYTHLPPAIWVMEVATILSTSTFIFFNSLSTSTFIIILCSPCSITLESSNNKPFLRAD
ncbi:hypothetical protein PVL29_013108 [Vitis rotundifolia]|uniref:Phospholipid-transporting ATPase n=1 Tax=Vitis rotundifolia TaxID=103349 RepID=A0AA38ZKI7_VITRO|nr:hypothetical protein PVL29_013108 [Vitis rotundifolia]